MILMTHLKLALFKNNSYEKQIVKSESIKIDDDHDFDFTKLRKSLLNA